MVETAASQVAVPAQPPSDNHRRGMYAQVPGDRLKGVCVREGTLGLQQLALTLGGGSFPPFTRPLSSLSCHLSQYSPSAISASPRPSLTFRHRTISIKRSSYHTLLPPADCSILPSAPP